MRSNEVVRKILEPLRRSLRAADHWDQFREKHTQVIADEKRSFGFDYEDAALDHREFEITNGKPKRSLTIYDQSYLVQEMQRKSNFLSVRFDPRGFFHDWQRQRQSQLSPDRRLGRTPYALPSPGRSEKARKNRND